MSNGSALKLTTARYYTPNGRSIQATGVIPTSSPRRPRSPSVRRTRHWKEADLSGHLENKGNGAAGAKPGQKPAKLDTSGEDYQLQEALNLLKGISIFRRKNLIGARRWAASPCCPAVLKRSCLFIHYIYIRFREPCISHSLFLKIKN